MGKMKLSINAGAIVALPICIIGFFVVNDPVWRYILGGLTLYFLASNSTPLGSLK